MFKKKSSYLLAPAKQNNDEMEFGIGLSPPSACANDQDCFIVPPLLRQNSHIFPFFFIVEGGLRLKDVNLPPSPWIAWDITVPLWDLFWWSIPHVVSAIVARLKLVKINDCANQTTQYIPSAMYEL